MHIDFCRVWSFGYVVLLLNMRRGLNTDELIVPSHVGSLYK
jgi:hypothetical protein